MKRKLNKEELRQMIINSVRDNDLSEMFSEDHIQEVMTSILRDYKMEKMQKVKEEAEIIPEAQDVHEPYNSVNNKFPYEEEEIEKPVELQNNVDAVIGKEAGAEPTELPSEPVMYTPELPVELQAKEPAEFFVYDFNDISVGGENLSNKAFHNMDNPEMKSSMADEWKNHGKTKAKVYVVKYEELGEIDFNYVTGQSSFTEKGKESHVAEPVDTFHENPYAAQSTGEIDQISTETDLTKTIESSVDLEAAIEKTLMKLLSKGVQQAEVEGINEGANDGVEDDDWSVIETKQVSLKDLFGEGFNKTETPEEVIKRIQNEEKPDYEGEEVKVYQIEENSFYFPKNPVSHKKCYIMS